MRYVLISDSFEPKDGLKITYPQRRLLKYAMDSIVLTIFRVPGQYMYTVTSTEELCKLLRTPLITQSEGYT